MNLLIVGKPGAGKGSVAEVFKAKNNIIHLSTGDIFRKEIRENTELGILANSFIKQGQLVPDSVTNDIIYKILKANPSESYLFDGYPRTVNQAIALKEMMKELGMKLDMVCDLEISDDVVITRLSGRRVCKSCGAIYQIVKHPPKVEGVCDICGGEVIQRVDDRIDAIKERLVVYEKKTRPLTDYYENEGLLVKVDGNLEPLDLYLAIMDIHNNKIN